MIADTTRIAELEEQLEQAEKDAQDAQEECGRLAAELAETKRALSEVTQERDALRARLKSQE